MALVDLLTAGLTPDDWSADGFHPGPAGYRKLGDAWFHALAPLLR